MSESEKTETKLTVGDVEVDITVGRKKPPDKNQGCSFSGIAIATIFLIIVALVWLSFGESSEPSETQRETPPVSIQGLGGVTTCEPGIMVGEWVITVAKVRMRSSPGYNGKNDTIGYCGSGERLLVLSGPSEKDGLCWWRVRCESSGKEGWMADHAQGGLRLLKPAE